MSIDVNQIRDKVIGIISHELRMPKEDVTPEKSIQDDLKADSLDIVELVMRFEEEFKVNIPDEDYDKIKTVGDAVKYIEDKGSSQQ